MGNFKDNSVHGGKLKNAPSIVTYGIFIINLIVYDSITIDCVNVNRRLPSINHHYNDAYHECNGKASYYWWQNIVIPAAENLFESALSVLPLSDPILLDR